MQALICGKQIRGQLGLEFAPGNRFAVGELAPAFQSGGKRPHSKYEGKKDFGADLSERCRDWQPRTNPAPIQLRKIG